MEMESKITFGSDKLEITRGELEDIFDLPLRTYADFKNKRSLIMFGVIYLGFRFGKEIFQKMIGILNYGVGNVHIFNSFCRLDIEAVSVTSGSLIDQC